MKHKYYSVIDLTAQPVAAATPEVPRRSAFEVALHADDEVTATTTASTNQYQYISTDHVIPSTVVCGRLFSKAVTVKPKERNRLKDSTLDHILYLKENQRLWNEEDVHRVVEGGAPAEEEYEQEDSDADI